jgi:HTH DNA binding domain
MSGLIREEDEDRLRPSWIGGPDETDIDLRPRRPTGPAPRLLCDAQDALSRLDALVGGTREPIRNGIIARMGYREASGWLAFAHAWVDPLDLALRDLGLTGSYALALRGGRSSLELPNTAASHAMEPWLDLHDDTMMSIDQTVAAALDVVRELRRNDGASGVPLPTPEGLLLPKAVFSPFWAAYPTLGREVNGLPALRGDVRARLNVDGPDAVYLHMVAEGARIALRELARIIELDRQGRGLVAARDRRSKLGAVLDILLATAVVTARGLAAALHITLQSATSSLGTLRAAGLIREVTGRESFRAFGLKI